jgi:hypothetical protein
MRRGLYVYICAGRVGFSQLEINDNRRWGTVGEGFSIFEKNNKTTWDQKPLAYIIAITTYVNSKKQPIVISCGIFQTGGGLNLQSSHARESEEGRRSTQTTTSHDTAQKFHKPIYLPVKIRQCKAREEYACNVHVHVPIDNGWLVVGASTTVRVQRYLAVSVYGVRSGATL